MVDKMAGSDLHVAFEFAKPFDDIQEAVPLPEDWYLAEIRDKATIGDNKTLASAKASGVDEQDALATDEKAGKSLNIPVQLIAEEPEHCRRMVVKLPYPTKHDLERYNVLGQCVYDSKLERIKGFAEALGADASGTQLVLSVGMKVYIYVQQLKTGDAGEERIINTIKIFGTGSEKVFKPYNE